jgi:uncharacterized protein
VTTVTALAVAADVAGIVAGVLWFSWRRRPFAARWSGEILALSLLGGLLTLAAVVTTLVLTHDLFAVVRVLCHVAFCVLAPIACWRGLALIVRPRGRGARLVGALLLLSGLAGEAVYVVARHVEPFRLQVAHERIVSSRLAGLERPIRVVLVADVQTETIAAYEREVARRIDAEQADLLLFLGDFISRRAGDEAGYDAELARFRDWVAGLEHKPPLGVFAVNGDCELVPDALAGVACTLHDEAVALATAVPIQLVGLSLPVSHRQLRGDLRKTVESFAGFSIVMGHAPDFMLWALHAETPPDALLVAGHCHGGQIVVPGFGPLVTLSAIPRRLALGELWHRGASWLRVSRGIGVERGNAPPLRLFCPPEIVVLDLAGS